MRRASGVLTENAVSVGLFVLVVVIGAELARPFGTASIAFDSQATVLYFQRIVGGQHLEAFVPTTPKPLMSLVFGTLYGLTHDWRSLAWLTIAVDAAAVTLTAILAGRIAGPLAAGFVGLGLANNTNLLFDVGLALATPYALLGLAIAGLAVTRERPRFAIAGVALGLAALARVETLVLAGASLIALGAWWVWAARTGRSRPPGRAWLLPVIALMAVPVMMLHDLLLTGDPLTWTRVAAEYSANTPRAVSTAAEVARQLLDRYVALGAVVLLAGVGVVRLLVERRWWLIGAVVALGPGVAAFLVFLALRHIAVPPRYAAAIDIAVIFAAGIGLASIRVWMPGGPIGELAVARLRSIGRVLRQPGRLVTAAAGAGLAVLLTQPYPLADPTLRRQVRGTLDAAAAVERAVPVVRGALAAPCAGAGSGPPLLVPGAVWPRVAVQLGLPLTRIGITVGARIDLAGGYPARCEVVLHVRAAEPQAAGWAALMPVAQTRVGGVTVEPLLADPAAGVWVTAIR